MNLKVRYYDWDVTKVLDFEDKESANTDFIATLLSAPSEQSENTGIRSRRLVISALHPEIAYYVACARGAEERYGRFVGLAGLEVFDQTKYEANIEEIFKPLPPDFTLPAEPTVCPKYELTAFSEKDWGAIGPVDALAEQALLEPPVLLTIDGLDDIQWSALRQCYGMATSVPIDLSRMVSSHSGLASHALEDLYNSIYHQGMIYEATSYAIPFLIRIIQDSRIHNRVGICEVLYEIAESCCGPAGYVEQSIIDSSKTALLNRVGMLELLCKDTDDVIVDFAEQILDILDVNKKSMR